MFILFVKNSITKTISDEDINVNNNNFKNFIIINIQKQIKKNYLINKLPSVYYQINFIIIICFKSIYTNFGNLLISILLINFVS